MARPRINDGLTNYQRYYWRHWDACQARNKNWRELHRENVTPRYSGRGYRAELTLSRYHLVTAADHWEWACLRFGED